jgi:hypothetical protein
MHVSISGVSSLYVPSPGSIQPAALTRAGQEDMRGTGKQGECTLSVHSVYTCVTLPTAAASASCQSCTCPPTAPCASINGSSTLSCHLSWHHSSLTINKRESYRHLP